MEVPPEPDPLDPTEGAPERLRGLAAARALVVRTVKDTGDDRVVGLSAEVAFFGLLAIPPTLLVLATTVGLIAGWVGADVQDRMVESIISGLGGFLADDTTQDVVRPSVEGVFAGGARGGVLSLGLLLAWWSSSRLIKVLIEAINIAYDVEEWRSAWKRRVLALGMMLGGILAVTVYLPFVVAGPSLGRTIDQWAGLAGGFEAAWAIIYWPLAIGAGIAILTSLYHVAPNWHTPWRRDLPGAALAALLWLVAAFALRVYVAVGLNDSTFGPLAAPVVLLLWLYVTAFAVLLGAELNAEIERMWPTPEAHPKVARMASAAWGRARQTGSVLRARRSRGGGVDEVSVPPAAPSDPPDDEYPEES